VRAICETCDRNADHNDRQEPQIRHRRPTPDLFRSAGHLGILHGTAPAERVCRLRYFPGGALFSVATPLAKSRATSCHQAMQEAFLNARPLFPKPVRGQS